MVNTISSIDFILCYTELCLYHFTCESNGIERNKILLWERNWRMKKMAFIWNTFFRILFDYFCMLWKDSLFFISLKINNKGCVIANTQILNGSVFLANFYFVCLFDLVKFQEITIFFLYRMQRKDILSCIRELKKKKKKQQTLLNLVKYFLVFFSIVK